MMLSMTETDYENWRDRPGATAAALWKATAL